MTEPYAHPAIRSHVLPAILALAVMPGLGACQYGEVQEPWVAEGQYEEERSRSAETAEQLRHRAMYNQIDR
ncbi:MAG: hypothetical protein U5S82_01740 [Gammaproteobacteria bacterium]|nr:hypothetical protein [Gammaproteobacteria bacterium]